MSGVTYVLVPGAASSPWHWHLLEEQVRARGHEVVVVDLPVDDDAAGLTEYADTIVNAVRGRRVRGPVVLVAHSFAGFSAPLVCDRVPVAMLVLLNAMVPSPGEFPGQWWVATGHAEAVAAAGPEGGPVDEFFHDLPAELAAQARARLRDQSDTPFASAWPLDAWPDTPTRVLISRGDQVLPVALQRTVAWQRLQLVPDEMDGGHFVALSRPAELADRLLAYADDAA